MKLFWEITPGCLLFDLLVLGFGYMAIQAVKSRWLEWIAAPYPNELEPDDHFFC